MFYVIVAIAFVLFLDLIWVDILRLRRLFALPPDLVEGLLQGVLFRKPTPPPEAPKPPPEEM